MVGMDGMHQEGANNTNDYDRDYNIVDTNDTNDLNVNVGDDPAAVIGPYGQTYRRD